MQLEGSRLRLPVSVTLDTEQSKLHKIRGKVAFLSFSLHFLCNNHLRFVSRLPFSLLLQDSNTQLKQPKNNLSPIIAGRKP